LLQPDKYDERDDGNPRSEQQQHQATAETREQRKQYQSPSRGSRSTILGSALLEAQTVGPNLAKRSVFVLTLPPDADSGGLGGR
jgi:hypothetical protein